MKMPPGRANAIGPTFAWICLVLLAAVVRFDYVLPSHLPVGDGGLFATMTDAVRSAGYPATFGWAGLTIPFVYPPLPFLVSGGLGALLSVPTVSLLQYLPPLVSLAGVPVIYILARRLTGNATASFAAMALYAVMPAAFDWLVAGGGLTRSIGMLAALISLTAAVRASTLTRGIVAGVFAGVTMLSHPQVGIFVAVSVLLIWTFTSRPSRTAVVAALAAGMVVVLPWMALLAARGQIGDLLAGGQRWDLVKALVSLLGLHFSGSGGYFDVFLGLGLVGLLVALLQRRWLLPAWVVLGTLATGGYFMVAVPWALAGGEAVDALVALARRQQRPLRLGWLAAIGAALLLMGVASTGWSYLDAASNRHAVTGPQEASMTWARDHLPPTAGVLVVSTTQWTFDLYGEWFSAIAERASLATPQGSEWLGQRVFDTRVALHQALETCAARTSDCLVDQKEVQASNRYIVIPKGRLAGPLSPDDCCSVLRHSVRTDERFAVVYDGPGATIARLD